MARELRAAPAAFASGLKGLFKSPRRVRGVSPKYVARLMGVPPAAELLHAAGKTWADIGRRLGRETMIAQASHLRRVPSSTIRPDPLRIVFFTVMGGLSWITATDLVLATALRARGHKVTIVLCDQALPLCEQKHVGQEDRWAEACGKCCAFGKAAFFAAGFEVQFLGDLARTGVGESVETNTVHVEAALLKHFRVGRVGDDDAVTKRRHALSDAAAVSARAAEGVVALRPDRVVMSHGNYATWGPARDVFNRRGVPVMVYAETTKRDHLRLHWREDSFWQEIGAEYERMRERPLSERQHRQLDEYLDSRRTQARDTRQYNLGAASARDDLRARLGLRDGGGVFVMFTNLMWDAAAANRELVYPDTIAWVLDTVDWFAAHPDRTLVIRPHPAEHVVGTKQSVYDVVRAARPSLPPNVTLLAPDADVNSWSLIDLADFGIVHTSTAGLELALQGKPCIVVAHTHYRSRGFTTDVATREEYLAALDRPTLDEATLEARTTLARRYAYILFERYQLPFPFHVSDRPADPVALGLEPGWDDHETIRLICRSIEQRSDPLLPAD